jgi:hypothetical protein
MLVALYERPIQEMNASLKAVQPRFYGTNCKKGTGANFAALAKLRACPLFARPRSHCFGFTMQTTPIRKTGRLGAEAVISPGGSPTMQQNDFRERVSRD